MHRFGYTLEIIPSTKGWNTTSYTLNMYLYYIEKGWAKCMPPH